MQNIRPTRPTRLHQLATETRATTMTIDDQREAARRARVQRLTAMSKGKVITGAELMRKHGLPDDPADIELGLKGVKTQQLLDLPVCVCPEPFAWERLARAMDQ